MPNQPWTLPGIRYITKIISAVHTVEALETAKSGNEKEDAAVKGVMAAAVVTEAATGRDLVDNSRLESATRAFIRAYVAIMNALAEVRELRPRPTIDVREPPPT